MKKFFLALLILGSLSVAAKEVCPSNGDALPWPWGTECPFPWAMIEGEWNASAFESADRFTFRVLSVDRRGGRTFEIKRYNAENELIAQGKGVASKRKKIIRAFLSSVQEEKKKNYWALVRAYSEDVGFTCNTDQLAVVITLRTSRPKTCEPDTHFIVKRDLPVEAETDDQP